MSKRKTGRIVAVIILGVLVFFLGHRLFFVSSGMIKQASSYVVYPMLLFHRYTLEPIKTWFESRARAVELKVVIDDLREERDILLEENITLRATQSYLEDTRELREFSVRYNDAHLVTTQVLARHFSNCAHFFLIDVGSNQGITEDMVAVYRNCLVGRVTEVYPWYSKVRLITDAACKVAAYCVQTRASGIHEGVHKENETTLRYVSHLNDIREHDLVISSGEGLIFPQGFALGCITEIQLDGLYYVVTIKPLIDLQRLRYCSILAKGKTVGIKDVL